MPINSFFKPKNAVYTEGSSFFLESGFVGFFKDLIGF
jgi:hypothetical protein